MLPIAQHSHFIAGTAQPWDLSKKCLFPSCEILQKQEDEGCAEACGSDGNEPIESTDDNIQYHYDSFSLTRFEKRRVASGRSPDGWRT